MSSSPYTVEGSEEAAARAASAQQIDPRRVRPDGTVEPEVVVDPEKMAKFLERVESGDFTDAVTEATVIRELKEDGTIQEVRKDDESPDGASSADKQRAIFQKVAIFLDPRLKGPVTILVERHKAFVMRLPVAQELIDVTAVIGQKEGEPITSAQSMMSVIGELMKGCYGWLPESSADINILRENIGDPKKWPRLRPIEWLSSRDTSYLFKEVLPLWEKYLAWRNSVQPTEDEIDFYYSQLR